MCFFLIHQTFFWVCTCTLSLSPLGSLLSNHKLLTHLNPKFSAPLTGLSEVSNWNAPQNSSSSFSSICISYIIHCNSYRSELLDLFSSCKGCIVLFLMFQWLSVLFGPLTSDLHYLWNLKFKLLNWVWVGTIWLNGTYYWAKCIFAIGWVLYYLDCTQTDEKVVTSLPCTSNSGGYGYEKCTTYDRLLCITLFSVGGYWLILW